MELSMKIILKLVVVLLVVLVVAAGALLYYVDSMAKKAIEYGGTEALGVATTLEQINISLLSGEARFNDLNVANPSGFSQPLFMGLGTGEFAVSLDSLSGDTVVIPKVRFADILVNLEQKDKTNNIQPILDRIKSLSGSSPAHGPSASAGQGKKFVLERLTIENVQVNAALDLLGHSTKVNLVLPKIELRDLGKDKGGMPMEELVQKVVQAILDAAAKSSGSLSPELASLLKGELKGLDSIKTEMIGKATAEVDKKVKEVQQQMSKQLEQIPLPAGADKLVEEKAGKLLKGLLDK
jgi:hypothetical protein